MPALLALIDKLTRRLRLAGSAIAAAFAAVFGEFDWYQPEWLRYVGQRLRAQWARLVAGVRARPRVAAAIAGLIVVVVGAGIFGWRWYEGRPKPVEIAYTVSEPGRTCYECEPPGKPNPLLVRFADSVAPLEAAGKDLDANKAGVTLSPTHPGVWSWRDDRTLQFQPGEDWPVGAEMQVSFARRGFVASHIRLKDYGFTFNTPAFAAKIAETQFYQDPVVATDKKAVVTVNFSHPVDTADFESRIKLKMYNKLTDTQELEAGQVAYTVTYDKLKLNAYLHSTQLTMPPKQGRLELTIAKGLRAARDGNRTAEPLVTNITVPGINSLKVNTLKLDIARDEKRDPQQVLLAEFSFAVAEKDAPAKIKAWLLPTKHPDPERQKQFEQDHPRQDFNWSGCGCMGTAYDNRVLEVAEPLPLTQLPGEQETYALHSYSYSADPKRFVYVRIGKGVKSFGGYILGDTVERVMQVPEYPRELRATADGSLMAMSGPKILNVFSRDVPAMRIEVGRLLPKQLQHLVTQSGGSFAKPDFQNWAFDASNITERFNRIETLPKGKPGTPQYTAVDLGQYMVGPGVGGGKAGAGDRRGIFLLKLQAWNKADDQPITTEVTDEWGNSSQREIADTRLIVITDLGLLVKRNLDGTQDVFVQSIHSGQPVGGVTVEVIGKNGLPVLTKETDAEGHARFANLKDFQREQQPVLFLARKDGDSSFMPVDWRVRELDLSRFDVGGVGNNTDKNALSAYLFSDRGIYRPGEEMRIAAIVKPQDWNQKLAGVPLVVEITDPRGAVVRQDRITLGAVGFNDIRHTTAAASPTGNYTVNLYIAKDKNRNDLIGSLMVQVRDFQPDRLKMSATLSTTSAEGWVSPQDLKARIALQNLFGTPAQDRRVTAQMTLVPSFPAFRAYADYQFHDPQQAREGFNEELSETKTDAQGAAEFDLKLQRFAKATYRLQFVAQGFEADGGRGVAAEATQLVSAMPFLVGYKADGDLEFVPKDSERSVALIAIDPKAQKTAVKNLTLSRIEIRYVSVLIKQNDGTYKYESRKKEIAIEDAALSIAADGMKLPLQTATPGAFAYLVKDADGQQLARVDYKVAGDANLTRSLEKNAELQITLSKKDYAPGEEIEMQINAPYTGTGLITIERDKVYSWQWFRADTTASTQRLRLPQGLEGNAYISVTFVRDPGSPEIYTSPLSYGVQPFSIALDARRSTVSVTTPAKIKPGETVTFKYKTSQPSRVVVFAIDEGILQVARYKAPDPLGHFFQKRSLDVSTRQILDLILPEFRAAMNGAAPGGDADGLLGKHLNPFKRKGDKPVAYWSGIVEGDSTERELQYLVPDYFNGTLRVFAVVVSDDAVAVFDGKTLVRGDFVLSPNAPTTVAPGDEFDVSVGVANNAEGSGADAKIALTLETTMGLKLVGERAQTINVGEMRESSARFRVKATEALGPADLVFTAKLGDKSARRKIDLSIRPAVPFRTELSAGSLKAGTNADVTITRELLPQYRVLEAGISALPLGLAHGFTSYLGSYPYSCTEQLVSQALPALVLGSRPEFGYVKTQKNADFAGLIAELRSRQNPDGGYRYWPDGAEAQEFVSLYVSQALIEAAERGQNVPRDLIERGNDYLRGIAARDGNTLEDERNTAYALYLLTRQGNVLGAETSGLQQRLEQRYKDQWNGDIAAAYLASALQLMKQTREAEKIIAKVALGGEHAFDRWHDPMVSDAELLYLLSRHFPQRLEKLPASLMDNLVKRIDAGQYHSLSAGTTLLALDAYAKAVGESASNAKLVLAEILRDGKSQRVLALPQTLLPKVDFHADAGKLRFGNGSELNAYWLIDQSGYDRKIPDKALKQGFEILREYTDRDGKALTTVKVGQEIDVHLKFRAIDREPIEDAALIDLLPGGFELVMQPQEVQQQFLQASQGTGEGVVSGEGGDGEYEGEGDRLRWVCPVCVTGTSAYPSYADFREDRIVFYTLVPKDLSEIVYRIKATNAGSYAVPPAYGESMYERQVQARSTGGRITVEQP